MTLVLALVLLLAAVPAQVAMAADKPLTSGADIRVMTANLLGDEWRTGNEKNASSRVANLKKLIKADDPWIIGAQEVHPSWYTAFSKLDSNWKWLKEKHTYSSSTKYKVSNVKYSFNTILYKKNKLQCDKSGVQVYKTRQGNTVEAGQNMVWGVFSVKEGTAKGLRFVFISTHWANNNISNAKSVRTAQAKELASFAKSKGKAYGCSVIVTGDFNCKIKDGQQYNTFKSASGYYDCGLERADGNMSVDTAKTKVDHVAISPDMSVKYYCYDGRANSNASYKVSDHPFFYADVKIHSSAKFRADEWDKYTAEIMDDTRNLPVREAQYAKIKFRYVGGQSSTQSRITIVAQCGSKKTYDTTGTYTMPKGSWRWATIKLNNAQSLSSVNQIGVQFNDFKVNGRIEIEYI
ncbi:MAG: endonuclease/exonuclease/phosphatase family protein, partial [Oscillospiraceae bacterium]|nr:endonuclease/exonuclease/phosphatase family protein [Oscillospiraceae bacterium]